MGENKAPGTDGIGFSFVKNMVGGIEMPLVLLFQKSLEIGQVPEQWKKANVTAIHKREGQRCDPGNYRPVSLTPQVGKLFERIIRDYLVRFLENKQEIASVDSGLRGHASRICWSFWTFVSDYVDECIPVDAIYLDFQKAFDKVSHMYSKLLTKMARYGIDDRVVRWAGGWLYGEWGVIGDGVGGGLVVRWVVRWDPSDWWGLVVW